MNIEKLIKFSRHLEQDEGSTKQAPFHHQEIPHCVRDDVRLGEKSERSQDCVSTKRSFFTFRMTWSGKWICLLSLNLVLGAATIVLLQSKSVHIPNNINERLSEIQSQLGTLQQSIKAPAEKIDLSSINQDFNHLTALIGELKPKDSEQLNQIVKESQSQLANKLDAMHTVITSLDQKQHPIKYLPVSALPFKIVSIDSIQQVSVASVEYDFKTIPLEKSDTLAGWAVLSVDFGQQKIELENTNKERVVVTMNEVEQDA